MPPVPLPKPVSMPMPIGKTDDGYDLALKRHDPNNCSKIELWESRGALGAQLAGLLRLLKIAFFCRAALRGML